MKMGKEEMSEGKNHNEKKPGSDLLSHTLACSTIGDEGLDF